VPTPAPQPTNPTTNTTQPVAQTPVTLPAPTESSDNGPGRKKGWDRNGKLWNGGDSDQGKPVADRIEATTSNLTTPVVPVTVAPSLPIVPPGTNCDHDSHDDGHGHDSWHGNDGWHAHDK
jgi:hypothetical protein